MLAQTYQYDLLNRFVGSKATTGSSMDDVASMTSSDYAVGVTYDANGNIMSLNRTMTGGAMLDQMTYKYATQVIDGNTFKLNNRLLHVNDAVTTSDVATDMEDQGSFTLSDASTHNYQYDAMGRMISNKLDGIALIEYNAYGKIKRMVPTDNTQPTVEYTYDAMQQRLSKKEIKANGDYTETFYAYDAMGVPMAIYTNSHTSTTSLVVLNDFMVYGSGRLGSYAANQEVGTTDATFSVAQLRFELTDHLGTVRAVISGAKTSEGTANIISLKDYYPYGMDMPGRSYTAESYRYGYQGSEKDNGLAGGTGYTTFFRALDPRIGRWMTPDPKVFPWQSPYCSMDCNPVSLVDVLGAASGEGDPPSGSGDTTMAPEGKYNDGTTGVYIKEDGVYVYSRGDITNGSILIDDITILPQ